MLAAVLLAVHLGRPALWQDETVSVLATTRSWPHLAQLAQGTEAPVVTYYALLKAMTDVLQVLPVVGARPELLYRVPSLVAGAVAAGLLAAWVSRVAGRRVAAAAVGLLLLSAGFSRYGQEARPYALALALAIAATLAWTRLVAPLRAEPPRTAGVLYALAVAGLAVTNVLAVTLVAAHLVAALVRPDPAMVPLARDRVTRTVIGAAAGLLLASPLILLAVRNGSGPGLQAGPVVSLDVVQRLIGGKLTGPVTTLVLALGALGVAQLRSPALRFTTATALAWSVVPPACFVALGIVHHGLQSVHRYQLFVLPGWCTMAAFGLVTLAQVSRRVAGPAHPRYGRVLGASVALTAMAGLALLQAPTLGSVRRPAGHGEDVRPVVVFADAHPGLPIRLSQRRSIVQLAVYAPQDLERVRGLRLPEAGGRIWPVRSGPVAGPSSPRLALVRTYRQGLRHRPWQRLGRCVDGAKAGSVSGTTSPGWIVAVLETGRRPADCAASGRRPLTSNMPQQ